MTRKLLARQHGNTLTGIIIGLIIGLGIAVVVALAITKGSSPFTDKSGKQPHGADTAPGVAADPNKPLYGNREAAREANKEIMAKAKPADDPLGAAIAGMGENKPAAAPAQAAPAPAAAPAAPAAAGGDVVYWLQAGAFREMADAESARAKLALLGFEASISDRTSDGGTLHRVRIGPFNQAEAMNKARAKLSEAGVDVAIVKNQK
ncbi:MAG TPA: SPOR domain-containing protein [Telluria sp.]|nr:SPOR domain-containing protein [Telluria sp.]